MEVIEVIINAARVVISDAISLMVLAGMFSPLICAYLMREYLSGRQIVRSEYRLHKKRKQRKIKDHIHGRRTHRHKCLVQFERRESAGSSARSLRKRRVRAHAGL